MPASYSPLQHEHIISPTSPCFVVPCRVSILFDVGILYTYTTQVKPIVHINDCFHVDDDDQ